MNDVDKAVETVEQVGSTLSSIIPQLFFDLIARLIPGLAIIWSFYLSLLGNPLIDTNALLIRISNLLPQNTFFLFCITVVVFYATSIAFYGLWSASVHSICRLKELFRECDGNHTNRFVEVLEASDEFSFRHDFIKLRAPIAGNRITKLKAEIHMSGALTATFGLCFLISVFGSIGNTLSGAELISRSLFFLLGALGFFFSNRHFSKRLFRSVGSYSELLNYEKNKYSFPKI